MVQTLAAISHHPVIKTHRYQTHHNGLLLRLPFNPLASGATRESRAWRPGLNHSFFNLHVRNGIH
ncbi:hypothetical protein GCM10027217_34600 [Pseudomaricurvus hydrocarbonicus]